MLSLRFYHYLQKNSSQKNGFLKKHLVIMKNFHILRFELPVRHQGKGGGGGGGGGGGIELFWGGRGGG